MHFFFHILLSLLAWVQSCKFIAAYNFPLEIPSFAGQRDLYVLEIKLKYKFGFKEHHLFWAVRLKLFDKKVLYNFFSSLAKLHVFIIFCASARCYT